MTSSTQHDPTAVRPFRAQVAPADVDDLRRRLAATRWPDAETVPDRSQGVRRDDLRALVSYWEHEFDWGAFESRLNRHPQLLTRIDGVDVHALHVRSPHPGALPLILTHGWPGSVLDFRELVGPLVDPVAHGGDPADAFDVVVPSLPGFGFSGAPRGRGWTSARTAAAWSTLMSRLGYRTWAAHGGDWGSVVTTELGVLRPPGLLGVHLSTPYVVPRELPADPTAAERRALAGLVEYAGPLGGANHVQATVPQTVGYALADSPVGQAAWIYDKYQSKTDADGRSGDALDRDAMLDTISLSWLTNTATSSARIYWENRAATMSGPELTLPVAVTLFPRDVPRMPRSWVEQRFPGLVHLGQSPRGGHFTALEEPTFLVDELRTGLRSLRPHLRADQEATDG